jgi:hypothetical protein
MSTAMDIHDYISVPEAAAIIGCTEGRVRQMIYDDEIEAVKINSRAWAVPKKTAEKLAKNPAKTGRPRKNAAGD